MSRQTKATELTRLVTTDELQLYKVLLDETREDILAHLSASTKGWTATELSRHYGLRLPTIMSHLKKLERVGAITRRERPGKHVNRTVVYYRAAVKVGRFRERMGQIDAAVGSFEEDLSEAILQFLEHHPQVIPNFNDPSDLWEWLGLLLKRTVSSIPEIVVSKPQRLATISKFQSLATKVAALSLLNDCLGIVLDEAMKLAHNKDSRLADIARKYGVRKMKDETDALFLFDLVEDLMTGNASKKLQAQVALSQLVEILPAGLSWKRDLKDVLPYIVRSGEVLDPRSAGSLLDFEIVDRNIDAMVARWKSSARILREALQKPMLVAAK
jgi:DNA-binding transcriptional ArsR family regulator